MKIVAMLFVVVALINALRFVATWREWRRGSAFTDGVDVALSAVLVVCAGAAVFLFLAGGQQ